MKIAERTSFKTFEDLECWKQCRTLRLFIAKDLVPVLPREERYRLGDQLLRAARSTTANIAEGYGRLRTLVGQAVKLLNGYMNYLKRASGDNRNLTTDNQ